VVGSPHVKVFDATTLATVSSFFAFDPAFRGGVTVAGRDANRTTISGIGSGASVAARSSLWGVPVVRVLDGATPTVNFLAYDAGFRGGVHVAWDAFAIVAVLGLLFAASLVTWAVRPAAEHVARGRCAEAGGRWATWSRPGSTTRALAGARQRQTIDFIDRGTAP